MTAVTCASRRVFGLSSRCRWRLHSSGLLPSVWCAWPLRTRLPGCPKSSVNNYEHTLRINPEHRRSQNVDSTRGEIFLERVYKQQILTFSCSPWSKLLESEHNDACLKTMQPLLHLTFNVEWAEARICRRGNLLGSVVSKVCDIVWFQWVCRDCGELRIVAGQSSSESSSRKWDVSIQAHPAA